MKIFVLFYKILIFLPAFLHYIPKHLMYITIIVMLFLLTGLDSTSESNLNGRQFTYLAFHSPPFESMIRGGNGTFKFFGLTHNVVSWLATRFKFKFSVVSINQTLVEKLGTHEAAFYQLMNYQDIDGILVVFYLTMDRVERFDFASFSWSEGLSLIVPNPGQESRLFAFVGPFQPMVWMLIFISLFVMVGMMTLFTWFANDRYTNALGVRIAETEISDQPNNEKIRSTKTNIYNNFSSHMIYVINIMTNQGGREAFDRTSFRILTGIWVLCATVLVNSYTGIVISSLTEPMMKPIINSFDDLAASKEVGIVLRSDTSIGLQMLQSTSGVYKVLADQARNNPDRIFADPFKLAAKLETGNYAYPFLHTFTIAFIGSQYKKDGKCRFKSSKPLPTSHGFYSLLYKKGSPYPKTISKGLLELWETGLARFWIKNLPTVPKAEECFVEKKSRVSRLVPIQLTDLTSAFLILGIGIGLATLSFLLELIYFNF